GTNGLDMTLKPKQGSPDARSIRGGRQRIHTRDGPLPCLICADDLPFAASRESHSHLVGEALAEEVDRAVAEQRLGAPRMQAAHLIADRGSHARVLRVT